MFRWKRNLCRLWQPCARKKDLLLIIDEVQTGLGRTGSFFSYQQFGVQPDIVSAAKGLGGGLPIGAVLFGEKTMDTMDAGTHGSTFGANPIVCAGANVVVDSLDDDFLSGVKEKSAFIFEKSPNSRMCNPLPG